MESLVLLVLLVVAYAIGSNLEKKHFKKIIEREKMYYNKPVVNFGVKNWSGKRKVKKVELVSAEVCLGADYFKSFISAIRNVFGGRMVAYESVLDRGRREAILRMREKAYAAGADIIVNVRIESSMNNNMYVQGSVPRILLVAYGTAVTYE